MVRTNLRALAALGGVLLFVVSCGSPTGTTGSQGLPGPSVYLFDVSNGNSRIESGGVIYLPKLEGSGSGSAPTTSYPLRLVNATGASLTVGTASTTEGFRVQYTLSGSSYASALGNSGPQDLSLTGLAPGNLAAGQGSDFAVVLQDLGYCYQNACLDTRRRFVIPLTDHSTTPATNFDFVFEVYGVIVC